MNDTLLTDDNLPGFNGELALAHQLPEPTGDEPKDVITPKTTEDKPTPSFTGEFAITMSGCLVVFKPVKVLRGGKHSYPSFAALIPANHEEAISFFRAIYSPERLANILRDHASEESQYMWKSIAKGDVERFKSAIATGKAPSVEDPTKLMKEYIKLASLATKLHSESLAATDPIIKAAKLAEARKIKAEAKELRDRADRMIALD